MTGEPGQVRQPRGDARPRKTGQYAARRLLQSRQKVREAELPYGDIGELLQGLRRDQDISARAMEFCMLTVCRLGEACDAAWDEFDFEARIWTIPAARSRSGKAHRVPLSDGAIAALEKVRGRDPTKVFPGLVRRAGHHRAFRRVLERLGWRAGVARDGRAAFQAWAKRTQRAPETVGLCLGHDVVLQHEAALHPYAERFERCRLLMQEWSLWCDGVRPRPRRRRAARLNGRGSSGAAA
jgi:integrase